MNRPHIVFLEGGTKVTAAAPSKLKRLVWRSTAVLDLWWSEDSVAGGGGCCYWQRVAIAGLGVTYSQGFKDHVAAEAAMSAGNLERFDAPPESFSAVEES